MFIFQTNWSSFSNFFTSSLRLPDDGLSICAWCQVGDVNVRSWTPLSSWNLWKYFGQANGSGHVIEDPLKPTRLRDKSNRVMISVAFFFFFFFIFIVSVRACTVFYRSLLLRGSATDHMQVVFVSCNTRCLSSSCSACSFLNWLLIKSAKNILVSGLWICRSMHALCKQIHTKWINLLGITYYLG